jgi:hypothetical protein
MPTRVLVTGDRNWFCLSLAERIIRRLIDRYGRDLIVVHGAARGVDSAFDSACALNDIVRAPYPADWLLQGKAAGPRRNQAMVDAGADFCIAVHRNLASSKGTKDCVRRCLKAGIPVWLIDSEDATPRPITEI